MTDTRTSDDDEALEEWLDYAAAKGLTYAEIGAVVCAHELMAPFPWESSVAMIEPEDLLILLTRAYFAGRRDARKLPSRIVDGCSS